MCEANIMNNKAATISVQAWESDGILLEQYAYTSGSVEPLPKHSHEDYSAIPIFPPGKRQR